MGEASFPLAGNNTAAILTIVGGVFYIIGGAVFGLVLGSLSSLTGGLTGLSFPGYTTSSISSSGLDSVGYAVAVFGVFSGILIIVGGLLFRSESNDRRKIGGILVIIMMLIGGLATLGGLLIGFILTAIGAYLGLTYRSTNPGMVIGLGPIGSVSLGSGSPRGPLTGTGPTNYCIKCGSQLRPGAIFCGACGERVSPN